MAQHLATPAWPTDGDFDTAATAYGEAFADHEETFDRAAGLPAACSRAARPARVQAAAAACLRYWAAKQQAFDDLPVLTVVSR
jgi:hypothetical protein